MTKSAKKGRTETASEAYARLSREVGEQIRNVEFRLQIHDGNHRNYPCHWGLVGDLGRVKELLAEILGVLGGGR